MIELRRHREILEIISIQRWILVQEIVERFNVSPATARRDLTKLARKNQLKRIRNGAEQISGSDSGFISKLDSELTKYFRSRSDEELRIANEARSLLHNDQRVAINGAETSRLMAHELCNQPYSVTTNYLPLARYLIENDHENVIVPGGEYIREHAVLIHSSENLSDYYCTDKMILSIDGVSENGIYKSNIIAALSERQLISSASKLIIIINRNCLDSTVGSRVAGLDKIDSAIVTRNVSSRVIRILESNEINIKVV